MTSTWESSTLIKVSKHGDGEYEAVQYEPVEETHRTPHQRAARADIPLVSFGPITVSGYINLQSFEAELSVKVLGISLGKLSGNLHTGITLKVNLFVVKGKVTFFLKGKEVWVRIDVTGYENKEHKLFSIPLRQGDPGDTIEYYEGFDRFEWVKDNRLARSNAPYYQSKDSDQRIDNKAVNFLKQKGIQTIISLNSRSLSSAEKKLLEQNKITYHHVPVEDYQAPTLDDLAAIWAYYQNGGCTVVWCGYGWGRTGTAISAIQLYSGESLNHDDYKANHVETDPQIKVLDELKQKIKNEL
ncbi:protein-tyrosine phosphatase family protein [Aspergillus alliaceus]|uniref:protein-tyrosine phosphatase family protein n=1 Tax=Petromyces alliaceus TaxID=209559 RepID=UPI0012A57C16|nr:protein-tyrosine phosphatase-like protein [Aspergillus alliaceus]KAB8226793.1 protein-tyrosine phosphatase-like protein [Aspergillus alliaceus]